MTTTPLPPAWSEFLRLMTSNEVRYMLIGGIAVGYHRYPRATGDIDLWVKDTPENGKAVIAVLEEFGIDLPESFLEIFLSGNKVFRFGRPPLRIKLLTGISGVEFQDCYPRRVRASFGDIRVDTIALEDLKKNMKASGRTNDIDDLAHLP